MGDNREEGMSSYKKGHRMVLGTKAMCSKY